MQRKMYELTNPQKSIWFTEEVFKATPISNIAGTVLIDDKVDFNLLEEAINIFVERNYSFRLKFVIENQTVKQYVEPYTRFSIEKINIHSADELRIFEHKVASTVFNVLNSRLFEFKLIQFDDGHGGFILNIHHLISDAWSSGFTASEIIKIYTLLLKNEKTEDIVYPSYVDYIYSEQEYLQSERYQKDKAFWNKIFEVIPEIATIPGDIHDEKSVSSCSSKRKQFTMQKDLINSINEFCKSFKISIYNFFIAVYSIYIGRTSGLDDFVIGSPILNRSNTKEKHTCGMFINTVPVKISLTNKLRFTDFASTIASSLFNILKHQKYQYLSILEDLRRKDSSIPNLYNILISYQNIRSTAQTSEIPFNINWVPNGCVSDDIDIHIFDLNDTGDFNIAYDYNVSKYSESEIDKIHSRFVNIIHQILKNENVIIDDIDILTDDERKTLLSDFNNTAVSYNKNETLSMLIEKQALKTPNRIALVFEDKKMTYKELNEKSNSLAKYLRDHGIKPNDIIGIMVNRSFEMIIAILAVLKAGGTYIPIDPEYPQDRIEYMLQNSNAKFLLTFERLKDKVVFDNMLFVELENKSLYSNSCATLKCVNKPEDSSYIIYTSGSTGVPKGVVLTHKALSNLTNYCNNYIEYLKNNTYRTIVSVTTVSFDIFIFETLISLQRGLKLVIANEDEQNIPRLLNNLIEKHNITIIQTTPARMQLFVNNYNHIPSLKNLDFITLAGEQLPITLANKLKEISGCTLYNGYGPSETTVFSTLTDVTNQEIITIGKPLDNTDIYILDKNLHLVPIGCVGEIYIAGDGLGKGYLNRPDLTEKAFISNPFVPGTLMYKTGDLGTFRTDGEILCFGRCDHQVKIRGLRIELEEIEKRILDNKNINNCVVTKYVDNNSHEYLCAYYTTVGKIDVSDLRKHLAKLLPKYMVPQFFMELERLPYTPNGKINRKLLPSPKPEQKSKEIILPRNDTDKLLVKLLQDLIGKKDISMDDSFFDLGGDSLTAINFCTMIYDSFSSVISVQDIFEHPIIMELSDIIATKKQEHGNKLVKAPHLNAYPVSYAQRSIYYASTVAGDSSVIYNIPGGLLLDNMPDIKKLEKCFQVLIDRHEALRSYFKIENEKLVQKIQNKIDFKLELDNKSITENEIKEYFNTFVKPFDLSHAPLIRVGLVSISKSKKYKAFLVLDIHHIICDGTSLQILTNELCKLYNSDELPKLNNTYKDFVWTEQEFLSSPKVQEAEKYWVSQFEADIPSLNMPTNFERPAVQSFDGSKVYFTANSDLTNKIEKICKSLEITPYMFTLAVYYVLLHNYTMQDDIVIGSPISGRSFAETNNLIGMFVNTLPIRMTINSKETFRNFLIAIKDKCFNNYKYQAYPFEYLLKKLNLKRDTSRNPIFDTIFTFQNTEQLKINLDSINATIFSNDVNISKFDLSLEIIPSDNGYSMNFEYCTKLFKKDFIENLCNDYLSLLHKITQNIDVTIQNITVNKQKNIHTQNVTDSSKVSKNNVSIDTTPRNNVDITLIKMYEELIDTNDVTIQDSLFDLGGDSLTAINLCTRIYEHFAIQLSVKDIFEHPAIIELSDIISSKTKTGKTAKLQKAPELSVYPVSLVQQGIYFSSIVAGNNSVTYNIPVGLLLDNEPNIKKLEKSIQSLIDRHEALRTCFIFNENTLVQKIDDKIKFKLEIEENPIKESNIKQCYNTFVKPFDLSTPPLFRAKLVKIEDSDKYKSLLLFDIHHIICDGTSAQILINELCKLYNSEELQTINFTYKDFAWSEGKLLSTNKIKEAENYWISQFEDNIPVLEMPTNFPRPAVQSFDGNKVYFSVSNNVVDSISNICKNLEITPYMFTLSAYYVLLNKYTSQNDIVVGSPINGRNYSETNNIVGMFVNTLPVRLQFNTNSSFKELLLQVKDKCSNNYKYQTYPFDELVKKLNIKRDTSRNPIFDTLFTFQNTINKSAKLGNINATIFSDDNNISKFDLSLEIVPSHNSYDMNFEYCTRLYTKDFIQNLSKQYVNILEQLIENIDLSLSDIKLLPEGKNLVGLANIDLGKIENCIYQYPNIDKAIVILNTAGKLTAYFSAKQQITFSDLTAFLQRNLPSYYIPEQIIQVEKFKLTDSGEIDISALSSNNTNVSNQYEEPITNYQKKLAKMFKDVLKLEDVSINDNFFDLGGDSLFAIQLQIEAFNNGLEFSYRDIFTYPTIKLLSEQISKKSKVIKEDHYDYTQINELISKNTGKVKWKKEKIKNILLTGATGFLGSHILNDLMINTRCNIYCLIRAKNDNDPQTRLLDTLRFYFGPKYDKYIFKRIFVVEGDITAPNLGLDDTYYQKIGESISCVINSAAIVKHYGNSQIFNATNVSGTQNIIDFCSKFNCKLMHLSTLSVSGNIFETDAYQVADTSTKTEFSEKDLYIGQDLSNIYIHTKFIAERLILENIINNNLNAKIIRLGNITNRYSDGAFQINLSENAFLNRIHSFMQLECIPDYLLDNYMELTPVDYCADAIVCLTMFKNPYTIFHVFNNNHITFRELKNIFDKLNINMKIVTKEEFNNKVKLFSNNPSTRNAISGIINDFGKDKLLKYYTNISIKNDFTNRVLKNTFFKWPKINKQYIRKYLAYLKSIGYIK